MSFLSEKPIKAVRKRHLCEACDKFIEIGEPAVNWCGLTDGYFSSVYYHPECREAEVGFNQDFLGWRGGDDWCRLCECGDHDARPWVKENYPVAYLRMCRTREQHANAHLEGPA